jgi:DNA-directed RNA polymerase specialized sigma24 family protein
MNASEGPSASVEHKDYFVTTRWTVVLSAGRKSSPQSDQALAELCRIYWYPLYAYVRRRGQSREDAEDLTQAFFARFLQKNYLHGLASDSGRFRAFLLACLKNFLANEWDKTSRIKRGGHIEHLSLDWRDADNRYRLEPPGIVGPDLLYDRQWATALLEQVVGQLKAEYDATGKSRLFEYVRGFLMVSQDAIPHADAARLLGMEEGALRVAVHRLRRRYRELLREEIAQTLTDPSLVDEELKSLQLALKQ